MFLMIKNPGVADPCAFTMLGVSTTRYAAQSGTIGQFGSGSKHSLCLLLRENISPIVYSSNLKMEFFAKPKFVQGRQYNQVLVKYSGKDQEGNTKNSTEDLSITLEWGIQDWTKLEMAIREFVSNAIDGAILSNNTVKDVEIDVIEKPRAKAGFTTVFLPYTPEIQKIYLNLGNIFLHLSNPTALQTKLLPKQKEGVISIYKNGVLVNQKPGLSSFDYNLGNELKLDESRNANDWDVKYACAKALGAANSGNLAIVLRDIAEGKKVWEEGFDHSYLSSTWDEPEEKEKKEKNFQDAWKKVGGENGVAVSGVLPTDEFIKHKGYQPIKIGANWAQILEKNGCPCESKILSGMEKEGKEVYPSSPEMAQSLEKVWNFMLSFNLTNGKDKPEVKGFAPIMSAGAQKLGQYADGIVYLHKDLGGFILLQTCLEEVVHHITGATDFSRDIQDFLFRLITSLM